jgi:hypothetical protein
MRYWEAPAGVRFLSMTDIMSGKRYVFEWKGGFVVMGAVGYVTVAVGFSRIEKLVLGKVVSGGAGSGCQNSLRAVSFMASYSYMVR